MHYLLQFKDLEQEELYVKYNHKNDSQTFSRHIGAFMLCSIIGSLMYIIMSDYVYFGLSSCFFIKCYVSLIVVRKSYLQLNMAAFFLQLEIQTLLPVLILLIDFKLNKGEVMIITASSQLLSLSLSVGSKMVLKSLAIIYQSFIQILICFIVGEIDPIWISFSIFTMIFHLQWAYFQEKDKRQKFVLHKNAELIESALINQIKIPIFRCRFKKETQQLKFISSNLQAKRSINITNQDTFNQFINNAEYDDIRSTSIQVPKIFGQTIGSSPNKQTLGYLIRQFFRKNLNEIYSYANINKNTNNYEFNCQIKEGTNQYELQLILLNDKQPYCLIILQTKQDERVQELERQIKNKKNIMSRIVAETSVASNNCLEMIKLHPMNKYLSGMLYNLTNIQVLLTNVQLIFHGLKHEPISEFNLLEIMQNLISLYQHEIYRRQIDIRMQIKNLKFKSQKLKIIYLLLNLLQNSIKYCHKVIAIEFIITQDRTINKTICCVSFTNDRLVQNKKPQFVSGTQASNLLVNILGPYRSIKQYQYQNEYKQEAYLFTDL